MLSKGQKRQIVLAIKHKPRLHNTAQIQII